MQFPSTLWFHKQLVTVTLFTIYTVYGESLPIGKIVLNFHSIQIIEKNHTTEDRLTAMLREWLESSPNPTWSDLVKALRSPDTDRPDIAAEIEVVYIKSDDSSVQESKDTASEYSVTIGSE